MDSLCHPWFTTTNLSYRFPIFETSATALWGTWERWKVFNEKKPIYGQKNGTWGLHQPWPFGENCCWLHQPLLGSTCRVGGKRPKKRTTYTARWEKIGIYIYIGWWFGTWFLFFHRLGIIIPTDFHIFQRGRYTTNQHNYKTIIMCLFFYVFLVYDLFVYSKSSVSVAHILMSWRVCWPLLLQVVEIIEDENIQQPSKDKWFASI